jgi:Zn finger protein HypA/HybF involved in hydrogenase expression
VGSKDGSFVYCSRFCAIHALLASVSRELAEVRTMREALAEGKTRHACPSCGQEFQYAIHRIRIHTCPKCESRFDDFGQVAK